MDNDAHKLKQNVPALLLFLSTVLVPACLCATAIEGLNVQPECERSLQTAVFGAGPANGVYYFLPHAGPSMSQAQREQLYWLDLELSHGRIFQALPLDCDAYIAVPDPATVKDASGHEEACIRAYLAKRAGWDEARLAHAHFFKVPTTLVWPQDAAEPLGVDGQGRLAMALGPDDKDFYRGFVDALVAAYPKRFCKRDLPSGISGEGGDLAVVRRPDGRPGLVLGRHRILTSLQWLGLGDFTAKPLPSEIEQQALMAYEQAYGLPVKVVPRRALAEGWGDEELFHLDMLAAFFSGPDGAEAVVSDPVPDSGDILAEGAYSDAHVKELDREYDAVAAELAEDGWKVQRVPLNDNPVRSPSNVVKATDGKGGRRAYLAKYPQGRGADNSPGEEQRLQGALARLNAAAVQGRGTAALDLAIRALWQELDHAAAASNRLFDEQAGPIRAMGWEVVTVPAFPWGAGGLHCQMLH